MSLALVCLALALASPPEAPLEQALSPAPASEEPPLEPHPVEPGEPVELSVETSGDYLIVDAAPASAFEEPRPAPVEFKAGAMTMTRVGVTRSRSVEGEGQTKTVVPNRLRARLEARAGQLHLLAEFQDARNFGDPIGPPRTGFHQLVVDYRTALPRGELSIKTGRQEYVLGSEHISGAGPWGATMRSFDAVRLIAGGSRGGVDLFAGSFARPLLSSPLPLVEHVVESVSLLWTFDGHLRVSDALTVGGLVLGTHQRTSAETRNIYTFGLHVQGDLGRGLSYLAEGYLQSGAIEVRAGVRAGTEATRHPHLAGASYAVLDYLTPEGLGEGERTKLGAYLSFDFASGSRCTTSEYSGLSPCVAGRSADFYAPWMARHRWFGHMDRFRSQNVIDGALGARAQVAATEALRLDLVVSEHLFAFPQPGGRWHAADASLVGVDLDNRNPWASNEVDIEATLRYRWLRLDLGWLLSNNLGGGRAISAEAARQFVYVQLTTNF